MNQLTMFETKAQQSDRSEFVYVIEETGENARKGICNIGKSKHVNKRPGELQTGNSSPLLEHSYPVSNCHRSEKTLHNWLEPWKMSGVREWFDVDGFLSSKNMRLSYLSNNQLGWVSEFILLSKEHHITLKFECAAVMFKRLNSQLKPNSEFVVRSIGRELIAIARYAKIEVQDEVYSSDHISENAWCYLEETIMHVFATSKSAFTLINEWPN